MSTLDLTIILCHIGRALSNMADQFLKLHLDVVEALAKADVPAEMRVILVVWRKTYGWNGKKQDKISISQFMEMTGLPRRTIYNVLNGLIVKKIICRSGSTTRFCKDFMKLNVPDVARAKNGTVPKMAKSVPNMAPTIDTYSIDNNSHISQAVNVGIGPQKPIVKKKPIVKTAKDGLVPCTPQELWDVAISKHVSLKDVRDTQESIMNLIAGKEFKHKTVYYTLLNWISLGKKRGHIQELDEFGFMDLQESSPEKMAHLRAVAELARRRELKGGTILG